MDTPKVSIITATYNSAKTVSDSILSVQKQSYANIEHLIIDGGSMDETINIVKHLGHQGPIAIGKDKGIYDAMNKGILQSTGDIIGILNSDDFYPTDDIIELVVTTLRNKSIDAVYADLEYVDTNDTSKVVRYWKSGKYKIRDFKYGWMPPHPTFFVRRKVYDEFGIFNLELKSAADYEIMLRFLYKHAINAAYIEKVFVKMRVGGKSNKSVSNRLKANIEDRTAWKLNNIEPYWFTLYLKPLRKVVQFF